MGLTGERPMDRLEVARFSSLPEAEMAAALLQRHGIDGQVPDRDTATVVAHMQLALGGLRVTAPDHQIKAARDLIEQVRAGHYAQGVNDEAALWAEAPPEDEIEGETTGALRGMRPVVRLVGGGILLMVLAGWIGNLMGWF